MTHGFDPLGFEQRRRRTAEKDRERDTLTLRLRRLEGQGHVRLRWFTKDHVRIHAVSRKLQVDFWPASGRWMSLPGGERHEGYPLLIAFLEIPESARPFDDHSEVL